MDTKEAEKTNSKHKAFLALQNEMAEQLMFNENSTANYAYAAELLTDEQYEKVFARDMRNKSDASKIMYLIECVRKKIQKASSREEARKKMNEFLDCFRSDGVFDGLVRSLEDKVAKFEQDPQEKQPEFKALKDPDILSLAVGSVHSLSTKVFSKGLITDDEHHFIVSGGNEERLFILLLLGIIGRQIRANPDVLEIFIKDVLDKIGPPVSALGDQLRELAGPSVN